MKVSICTLTYNHEEFIAQAIESVLMQQTDHVYELVIGEDASTDETRSICQKYYEEYPDRIRLLLHDSNVGMMMNFMQVLAACDGDFIAILEGDDYWLTADKLQNQVEFLLRHTEYVACFTDALSYRGGNEEQPIILPPCEVPSDGLSLKHLLHGNIIPTGSIMYRSNLIDHVPDWFIPLPLGDWPFHMLHAQHGNIGYIPQVTTFYRIHPCNNYVSLGYDQKILAEIQVYRAMRKYLGNEYRPLIDRMMANRYSSLVRQLARQHRFVRATLFALYYAVHARTGKPSKTRLTPDQWLSTRNLTPNRIEDNADRTD